MEERTDITEQVKSDILKAQIDAFNEGYALGKTLAEEIA